MKKLLIIFILLQVSLVLAVSPPIPFPVALTFYESNEPLSNFNVCFQHQTTKEKFCVLTTNEGELIEDMANLKEGYSNEDLINISYCINTTLCKEKSFLIEIKNNQGGGS